MVEYNYSIICPSCVTHTELGTRKVSGWIGKGGVDCKEGDVSIGENMSYIKVDSLYLAQLM